MKTQKKHILEANEELVLWVETRSLEMQIVFRVLDTQLISHLCRLRRRRKTEAPILLTP